MSHVNNVNDNYGWDYDGSNHVNNASVAEGALSNVVPRHNSNENLTSSVGNAHHFESNNDHYDICGTDGNSSACCQWEAGSGPFVPKGYAGPGFGNFSCRTFYCHDTAKSLKEQPSLNNTHGPSVNNSIVTDWTVPSDSELIAAGFLDSGSWPTNAKECELPTNNCAGTTCRFVKHMQTSIAGLSVQRPGLRDLADCTYAEYHNAALHQNTDAAGGYQCVMAVKTVHDDLGKKHSCKMTRDTITGVLGCDCTCETKPHMNGGTNWTGINSGNVVASNMASPAFDQ